MWPFNDSNDSGCGMHHYGKEKETSNTELEKRTYTWVDGEFKGWGFKNLSGKELEHRKDIDVLILKKKHKKFCQHEGCTDKKEIWKEEKMVPLEELEGHWMSMDKIEDIHKPEEN